MSTDKTKEKFNWPHNVNRIRHKILSALVAYTSTKQISLESLVRIDTITQKDGKIKAQINYLISTDHLGFPKGETGYVQEIHLTELGRTAFYTDQFESIFREKRARFVNSFANLLFAGVVAIATVYSIFKVPDKEVPSALQEISKQIERITLNKDSTKNETKRILIDPVIFPQIQPH